MNNPPPIFNRRLTKLPSHIHQSADLQTLICRQCNTAVNLGYEPNFYEFLNNHAHATVSAEHRSVKPWPSFADE